jgi:hypothetical protein
MKASCAQRAPGGLSARLPGTQECPADATAAGTAWQWPSGLRAVLGAVARAPSRFWLAPALVNWSMTYRLFLSFLLPFLCFRSLSILWPSSLINKSCVLCTAKTTQVNLQYCFITRRVKKSSSSG